MKNRPQIDRDFSNILQKHGMMLLLHKKDEVGFCESRIVAQNENVVPAYWGIRLCDIQYGVIDGLYKILKTEPKISAFVLQKPSKLTSVM